METSIHNNKYTANTRPGFIKWTLNWASLKPLIITVAILPILNACSPEPSSQNQPEPLPTTQIAPLESSELTSDSRQESAQAVINLFHQIFNATLAESEKLKSLATDFYATPSSENLAVIKEQWIATHKSYTQLSALFNLIDASEDLFYELAGFKTVLDAQPILPGYLDSFGIYTDSGIVNDLLVSINAETIRGQHQITDSEEVSLGLHAIEFLLWGADGTRTIKDFIAVKSRDLKPNQTPQNRRRDLIRLQTQLLHDDLTALHLFWQKNTSIRLKNLEPISQLTLWNSALKTHWQTEVLSNINDNGEIELHHEFFSGIGDANIPKAIIGNSIDLYLEIFSKQLQVDPRTTASVNNAEIITKLQSLKSAIEISHSHVNNSLEDINPSSENNNTANTDTFNTDTHETDTHETDTLETDPLEDNSALEDVQADLNLKIQATEILNLLSI
ncbi:imelysin family protein [Sessilibacter sp. MAH4]